VARERQVEKVLSPTGENLKDEELRVNPKNLFFREKRFFNRKNVPKNGADGRETVCLVKVSELKEFQETF